MPSEPRDHNAQVRFTKKEMAVIDNAAKAAGMNRAEFLRDAAFKAAEVALAAAPEIKTKGKRK